MTERVRRDPDVLPGRRDRERGDPPQRLLLGDIRAGRGEVPEAFRTPHASDARTAKIAAHQPGDGSHHGRVEAHDHPTYHPRGKPRSARQTPLSLAALAGRQAAIRSVIVTLTPCPCQSVFSKLDGLTRFPAPLLPAPQDARPGETEARQLCQG